MDDAFRLQKIAVTVQEQRGRQALVLAGTQLGIGKSKPDFGNFTGAEKSGDELYPGAEEGHIWQSFRRRCLGPAPETRPLDIHTYIILVGIAACQFQGVLPLSAAEFQHDFARMPAEHLLDPMPFDRMVGEIGVPFRENLLRGWLEEAAESFVFGEFTEFIVSHRFVCRLCRGLGRSRADLLV